MKAAQMNTFDDTVSAKTICQRIDGVLEEFPDKTFLETEDATLRYRDCKNRIAQYHRLFGDLGVDVGDRILIRSEMDVEVVCLFLAALRTGVTPVLVDAHAADIEVMLLMESCDVAATFVDAFSSKDPLPRPVPIVRFSEIVADFGQPSSEETTGVTHFPLPSNPPDRAMLVLTSGTTSTPKAVEITYTNLVAQLDTISRSYGFDENTVLFNLLPLHHVDGLIRGPLAALWNAGCVLRKPRFSVQKIPEIFKVVGDAAVTHIVTVPAALNIMERMNRDTQVKFNTPHFKAILCSSDLLDGALWARSEEAFGTAVVNSYGLSEVTCDVLISGQGGATRDSGTLGVPVDCTVKIVDEAGQEVATGETGELLVAGATVMKGYFRAPEATADVLRNGFFHTGDYFRVGSNGQFEFVGRKKTSIVSAGFTIHPEAATQVLARMPGVVEAVAFAVPDEIIGQKLVGAIVNAEGHTNTVADAAAFCRSELSKERAPRDFVVLDALPRGGTGKVAFAQLVELYQARSTEMQPTDPEPKILSIAASCFNVNVDELTLQSTPFDTPSWDSLAHINLIESLEEAFDIVFSASQISQIFSLQDAAFYIDEALAASP